MIKDNIIMLREAISEFQTTGTFFATSKWAAEELTCPLKHPRSPKRILELGPGTGSVTYKIIEKMMPGDTLSICEINPRLMRELKINLNCKKNFQKFKEATSYFEGPIQEFPESGEKFDVIVCSLPFLNFERDVVEEIFQKLERLSNKTTVMTYYQFIGVRSLRKKIGSKEDKKRMTELESFFDDASERLNAHKKRVWLNMFPINVYTLEMAA